VATLSQHLYSVISVDRPKLTLIINKKPKFLLKIIFFFFFLGTRDYFESPLMPNYQGRQAEVDVDNYALTLI
jgi:hypothetical protein